MPKLNQKEPQDCNWLKTYQSKLFEKKMVALNVSWSIVNLNFNQINIIHDSPKLKLAGRKNENM
jgi:hypothetical protein